MKRRKRRAPMLTTCGRTASHFGFRRSLDKKFDTCVHALI